MRVAIIEDVQEHADCLKEYLLRFALKNKTSFDIDAYTNAVAFLDNYSGRYDIIFMDINMPYLNGMDAARRLREADDKCILIFITSLAQYAIEGYSVNALDYILKPITYPSFAIKFNRAYKRVREREKHYIILQTPSGSKKLEPEEIAFVEVDKHTVIYHTADGDYTRYESLKSAEEKLADMPFVKCNRCYLVNLAYVREITSDTAVVVLEDKRYELIISRNHHKHFCASFKRFHDGNFGG